VDYQPKMWWAPTLVFPKMQVGFKDLAQIYLLDLLASNLVLTVSKSFHRVHIDTATTLWWDPT
jgi:hypothetical protein